MSLCVFMYGRGIVKSCYREDNLKIKWEKPKFNFVGGLVGWEWEIELTFFFGYNRRPIVVSLIRGHFKI